MSESQTDEQNISNNTHTHNAHWIHPRKPVSFHRILSHTFTSENTNNLISIILLRATCTVSVYVQWNINNNSIVLARWASKEYWWTAASIFRNSISNESFTTCTYNRTAVNCVLFMHSYARSIPVSLLIKNMCSCGPLKATFDLASSSFYVFLFHILILFLAIEFSAVRIRRVKQKATQPTMCECCWRHKASREL